MASGSEVVRQAANRVNSSLMDQIAALPEESSEPSDQLDGPLRLASAAPKETATTSKEFEGPIRASVSGPAKSLQTTDAETESKRSEDPLLPASGAVSPPETEKPGVNLDYGAAVNALTLHFLNQHEATRVAALAWLIMLHRRAPRKVLVINDGTFPALLKTLSDPSEAVVTRDLQLLSQILKNSEDGYFVFFMNNLLQLFSTDRKLLETRGNLIIRQLCVSLSAERIYRTLADCLERDEVC